MLRVSTVNNAPNLVLWQLFWLRNAIILLQIIGVFIAVDFLDLPLPLKQISHPIILSIVFNIFLSWRIKKAYRASESEIFINLAFDSIVLGLLVYYSGGINNPFITLLLIPLAIAATTINLKYLIGLVMLSLSIYGFIMYEHFHMTEHHHHMANDFELHLFGMWLNFILSALVILVFISNIASQAKKAQKQLAESQQRQLRDEYIISLGTLAAGTAHEISTPLSNIGMMADELSQNPDDTQLVEQFSSSIKQQQQHCVKQLDVLRNAADQARYNLTETTYIHDYLDKLTGQWKAMRPEMVLKNDFSMIDNFKVSMDQTISHAIFNLLNNAADASLSNGSNAISISSEIIKEAFYLHIDDYGPGLSKSLKEKADEIVLSSKTKGFGIGLLLSHSSLARYDGSIKLQQRNDGVRSTICIPLAKIRST